MCWREGKAQASWRMHSGFFVRLHSVSLGLGKEGFLSNYPISWLFPGLCLCPPPIHFFPTFQASAPPHLMVTNWAPTVHARSQRESSLTFFLPPLVRQTPHVTKSQPSFPVVYLASGCQLLSSVTVPLIPSSPIST